MIRHRYVFYADAVDRCIEIPKCVLGNARRDFGKDFMISVPTVVAGEPEKVVTPDNIRSFVIPINWRSYAANVVVCLQ